MKRSMKISPHLAMAVVLLAVTGWQVPAHASVVFDYQSDALPWE
jgi:hypothetical protein